MDKVQEVKNKNVKLKNDLINDLDNIILSISDKSRELSKKDLVIVRDEISKLSRLLNEKLKQIDEAEKVEIKNIQDKDKIEKIKKYSYNKIEDAKKTRDFIISQQKLILDENTNNKIKILDNINKLNTFYNNTKASIEDEFRKKFEAECENNKDDKNFDVKFPDMNDKTTKNIITKLAKGESVPFQDMSKIMGISKKEKIQQELDVQKNEKLLIASNILEDKMNEYNTQLDIVNTEIDSTNNYINDINNKFDDFSKQVKDLEMSEIKEINANKVVKYSTSKFSGRFDFIINPIKRMIKNSKVKKEEKQKDTLKNLVLKYDNEMLNKDDERQKTETVVNSFIDDLKQKKATVIPSTKGNIGKEKQDSLEI